MSKPIALVTCATGSAGNIGGVVARTLYAKDISIRIGARNIDKATQNFKDLPEAVIVKLDLADPTTFQSALQGATHVFLGHPDSGFDALEVQQAFMDAVGAVQPNPPRVVKFHGGLRPELTAPFFEHAPLLAYGIENTAAAVAAYRAKHGAKSLVVVEGAAWFFQNYTSFFKDMVTAGCVMVPNSDARLPRIDSRDIGEAVAAVLLDWDTHAGSDVWLTGGARMSESEIAAAISKATGRNVTYADQTNPAMEEGMRAVPISAEHSLWDVIVQLWAVEASSSSQPDKEFRSLSDITGRPYRTFEDFCAEHAATWKAASDGSSQAGGS